MSDWDRSHEYVLVRFVKERAHLELHFTPGAASSADLIAIRKGLPEFRHVSPAALRKHLGTSGHLDLGDHPRSVALERMAVLRQQGLTVSATEFTRVDHLIYDKTIRGVILIEDSVEKEEVVREMMAAGMPIRDQEDFYVTDPG